MLFAYRAMRKKNTEYRIQDTEFENNRSLSTSTLLSPWDSLRSTGFAQGRLFLVKTFLNWCESSYPTRKKTEYRPVPSAVEGTQETEFELIQRGFN